MDELLGVQQESTQLSHQLNISPATVCIRLLILVPPRSPFPWPSLAIIQSARTCSTGSYCIVHSVAIDHKSQQITATFSHPLPRLETRGALALVPLAVVAVARLDAHSEPELCGVRRLHRHVAHELLQLLFCLR